MTVQILLTGGEETTMFLVRTKRTSWSSASAANALDQAEAMRQAGHLVTIEGLGRQRLSLAALQRASIATNPRTHQWSSHDFRS